VLRTARRAITGTLGTMGVALVVAMVAGRCVAAIRWMVGWPADGDRWWSLVLIAGALLSIAIVRAAHSTGETTLAFVRALDDPPGDLRPVPARTAATATGVGLGLPLGVDGPALHLGGALAARLARLLRRGERGWTMAGGVAALAMAIGAPVAAATFAIEIGRRRTPRRRDIMPLAVGALAGWIVRRLSGDEGGVLGGAPDMSTRSVAAGAITIGIVCGVASRWFRPLLATARSRRWGVRRRLTVAGASLGLAVPIGWAATGKGIFIGSGDRMGSWAVSASALHVTAALVASALLLVALVAADLVGGLLLPLIALGGLTGLVLARTWLPSTPTAFVVIAGGCAVLAAVHSAPVTATAVGFAAMGWSAASWATAAAVLLATLSSE
jgi:chloride channel protein, CIC family